MRTFIVRYRINRSWGDGVAEALCWALRGKSFPEMLDLASLNESDFVPMSATTLEMRINQYSNKGDK